MENSNLTNPFQNMYFMFHRRSVNDDRIVGCCSFNAEHRNEIKLVVWPLVHFCKSFEPIYMKYVPQSWQKHLKQKHILKKAKNNDDFISC